MMGPRKRIVQTKGRGMIRKTSQKIGPGMKPGLRKESTALTFAVNNHPKGNWILVVRIDGDEVLRKSIEASSSQEFQFDLTKHAGETIKIKLENRASAWAFEAAYWSRIERVE